MNYSYLDSNNQPAGPASLEEIRTLSRSGAIPSDPLVKPEGSADWRPLSAPVLPPPPPASPHRSWPAGTMMGDFVASLLDRIARWLNPAFVERSLAFARDTGQFAVLVGGALTLLYAIYAAIKFNSFALFLTGLGLVAALAVAQFAATRFLNAAVRTIANTPSRIGSPAFLECAGLLILLGAAGSLLGGLVTSIQVTSIIPLLPAVFFTATLVYFGAIALHPKLVNVEPGDGTAGEEAIGLLSFFCKTGLKLVPLFFLLLAVGGDLAIIASFFSSGQAFASSIGSVLQTVPLPMGVPYGLTGSAVVLVACLLPLVAYFIFLLQYLLLDVLRAVLCVPAKLDALRP